MINSILYEGYKLANRYQIVTRLGVGNMGDVYLAVDTQLNNLPRAIKRMHVTFLDQYQYAKAIEDFKREVTVLAKMEHPAIPAIYDYFLEAGYYYLVMKYINGKNLLEMLEKNPDNKIPEKTVTEWAIQLCDVLDFLHSSDPPVIYRDMKPSNIMYDEVLDKLVLIDFGIARFINNWQQPVTAVGTIGYAPPELYGGKVVPASDIYSLGATLFHLLTGQIPLERTSTNREIEAIPRLREIDENISSQLEDIVLKSVESKPVNRYPTAASMQRVLIKHLQHLNNPPASNLSNSASFKNIKAKLTVLDCTKKKAVTYKISKKQLLLGRFNPQSNIKPDINLGAIDDTGKISRKHAAITWENGIFYFEDLGSANGSKFNGIPLKANEKLRLRDGDQVALGGIVLEFSID